jgi:hypothetical protein
VGLAHLGGAAGELELLVLCGEGHAHASGLLVGEQCGPPDGGEEHIAVEADTDVLVLGDDVLVGGEGALDEVGGEDGAGVGGVLAEAEDDLVVGNGEVDRLVLVVDEFLKDVEGLGGDDAGDGLVTRLGGGDGGAAVREASSVGGDEFELLAGFLEEDAVDGVPGVFPGGGEDGARDDGGEGAGGEGEGAA